ncbi:MAG: tetratricopeptide repeat protein, partial [Acidobacteriota bacterium]
MQSSNKATAVSTTGKRLRPDAGRPKNALLGRSLSPEKVTATFLDVGQKLRAGLSSEAQKTLVQTIENYRHSADEMADLKRLLAFTLETLGRYTESLEVLRPYESEELLGQLAVETRTKVQTQLAISYNNLGDHPRAVTLLKETLAAAKQNELTRLFGTIDLALARVYRKLNELPICRDYAEKSLVYFRESGDWLNMAEAYREVALSYSLSGNSSRSLEYFELGIQIIGDRSAPFMLGKIYTEMSGAYWFLRRPHDGIECLEKSIAFFDQTEHLLNSVIAYNNLGINLTLVGEWARAEKMIRRALDLAVRSNHVHAAGILDSLGELKILRGELNEAEELLVQAVAFARERNREWYVAQAMRNLARCYLAQGNLRKAAAKARETIELGKKIGEKNYANMAGLVLAESMIAEGKIEDAETELQQVEANEASSDFFVLGNIQRIRGLAALENGDPDLAVHYFYRSLTTFEAAEDIYHAGLVHLLIGTNLGVDKSHRAIKQLARAREIFAKLGVDSLANEAAAAIKKLESTVPTPGGKEEKKKNSVVSQLLTVRLAEAVASRELLFRELVAVLQQESPAKRIIVAQPDDRKNLIPFITHGYSPSESSELVANLDAALKRNEHKVFARAKNIEVLPLKAANSSGAYLMIFPQSAAQLNDGSPLQPLLRVMELGMEVVALRDRDRAAPIEHESSPYASNSLMPGFIHSSPGMTALVEEVYKIRSSDVTVLVTGDSGTGKELVSRAIHTLSNRKDKIFVPFNCTAVPKELAEG